MSIFEYVVRWFHGRPICAGNCYDPGDMDCKYLIYECPQPIAT